MSTARADFISRVARAWPEALQGVVGESMDSKVTALIAKLEKRFTGLTLWLHVNRGGILILSKISLPKEQRGAGVGSRALEEIVRFADKHKIAIALTPDGATGKAKLTKWYRSYGFVPNKGRNKTWKAQETMVRWPR